MGSGLVLALSGIWLLWPGTPAPGPRGAPAAAPGRGFAGAASCRECHEKFYKLWSTSHHGLAMQPVTPEFLETRITFAPDPIHIKEYRYRAVSDQGAGWVLEHGPQGERKYRMAQALGGKNVYYFLTPMDKGRLQVLPVAYDVRKKKWFDTTRSMLRHLGTVQREKPLYWQDPLLTFNTACYGCHVSQFSSNYDLQTDTYHSAWTEPGINCETCHGPGAEHNRICREAPPGTVPPDLKIISSKKFTIAQHNDTCSPCHAKMIPLTPAYTPGERFFDHYDLVTLEDADFYPDARDLGENFTLTLWLTSPCVKSGKLSCLHCHTSSGRYRFQAPEKANRACLPCHGQRVANAAAHTRHPPDKPGAPQCISCHMPLTEFARMRRSDHSLRPPAPAATLAFQSPNACNLCHRDKDAAWADQQVRQWQQRDYQKEVLRRAALLAAARRRDWSRLPEILQYINDPARDEVYAAGLIRLLAPCGDPRKWPALAQALKDASPLVRGAAAAGLEGHYPPEARDALLAAVGDDYRLVRIRAARTLAAYPRELLSAAEQLRLEKADRELLASLTARPDDWASHYNLGNYYLDRREPGLALAAFTTASRLRPDAVMPLVNGSIAQARMGQAGEAEASLRRALRLDPENAPANFNLGLVLAEKGDQRAAEQALRSALKADPELAAAAYNLGVLLAPDRLTEALLWLAKARKLRQDQPKYAYTLAFYQRQKGDLQAAIPELRRLLAEQPAFAPAYFLLGEIFQEQGKGEEARQVYRRGLARRDLPAPARQALESKLQALSPPGISQ
ncbi:MAG: ammonia-forming cytochrome c nitrite reductase subunit c552 [Thermodesulfobacteriota bacterium]